MGCFLYRCIGSSPQVAAQAVISYLSQITSTKLRPLLGPFKLINHGISHLLIEVFVLVSKVPIQVSIILIQNKLMARTQCYLLFATSITKLLFIPKLILFNSFLLLKAGVVG